jgi:hypothetical protein
MNEPCKGCQSFVVVMISLTPETQKTPRFLFLVPRSHRLPAGLLGGSLGPVSSGGGTRLPGRLSLAPLASGSSREASRGSLPVGTSAEAALESSRLLLDGELLLLDLLLGLGLRVAV